MTEKVSQFAAMIGAALFFMLAFYLVIGQSHQAFASAPSGLPATVATTSSIVIGTTSRATLFAASTCSARIITTYAQPAMLSFSAVSSTSLSQTIGHLQSASTTVVYDSGQFGCGQVNALGETYSAALASSTIFLTETQ